MALKEIPNSPHQQIPYQSGLGNNIKLPFLTGEDCSQKTLYVLSNECSSPYPQYCSHMRRPRPSLTVLQLAPSQLRHEGAALEAPQSLLKEPRMHANKDRRPSALWEAEQRGHM